MIDSFEIITTSGVVLWSKTYVPVGPSLINNLIREVFIEERGATPRSDNSGGHKPTYRRDGYTLKWTAAKDLGIIFVVCCGYCGMEQLKRLTPTTVGRIPIATSNHMDRQATGKCTSALHGVVSRSD